MSSTISNGLDRAFDTKNAVELTIGIDRLKLVVFSDHHRGAGDGADDFNVIRAGHSAKQAYNAALGYYLAKGYGLIVLGDVEELWECWPGEPVRRHHDTLKLEAQFNDQGCYWRCVGNHDDAWKYPGNVTKHLAAMFKPEFCAREGVHLFLVENGKRVGRMFMTHGHQGSLASDRWAALSKIIVRYVNRPLQRLFRYSWNTPAKDLELRAKHDKLMYDWAVAHNTVANRDDKLVLIAGHTHHPVFGSLGLVAQLDSQIMQCGDQTALPDLRARREWAAAASGFDAGAAARTSPCYFNTGCCCFADGDITGIELSDGMIRLVRWPDDNDFPRPKVLAETALRTVFSTI
ncbi:MAG: hypothetical protein HYX75_14045 [Acidobacteria bacterium]|nr:hypothetical protein [Acidobacteriota bacterium]